MHMWSLFLCPFPYSSLSYSFSFRFHQQLGVWEDCRKPYFQLHKPCISGHLKRSNVIGEIFTLLSITFFGNLKWFPSLCYSFSSALLLEEHIWKANSLPNAVCLARKPGFFLLIMVVCIFHGSGKAWLFLFICSMPLKLWQELYK